MSINQRKHTRFSLDIPATIVTKFGDRQETLLQQISIGGCFTDWEENIYAGDEFRLEIELPNKNRLPLKCKAIYRFEDTGIGVRFYEISQFEQELISKIISERMIREGLPIFPDPFNQPSKYIEEDESPKITNRRLEREEMLEKAMSGEEIA
ncbi:MAG: PilZ domain-containing protein [Blastocatellia bacterium]|nr:PilZ domain-containing protein [Blastocatellia bacterium]